jgi:hypothetical protein
MLPRDSLVIADEWEHAGVDIDSLQVTQVKTSVNKMNEQ